MNIKLFINNSENNKVNKSITYVNELDGILRYPTSLINPIIDIELADYNSLEAVLDVVYPDDIDITYPDGDEDYEVDAFSENQSIFNINYCYIDEFDRYYFIDNIDVINNKLFRLYMSVDVLMSHKLKFMSLSALVNRNEFLYNDYIDDPLKSYRYDKLITYYDTEEFELYPATTEFDITLHKYNYVWVKLSSSDRSTDRSGYIADDTMTGDTENTDILVLNDAMDVASLSKAIVADDVLLTYVKHLMAYPFQPDKTNSRTIAYYIRQGLSAVTISASDATNNVENLYLGTYKIPLNGNYLDYSPYTQYEVYIPYYGWLELSGETLKQCDGEFSVYYLVNYSTAESQVYVRANKYPNMILFSSSVALGVNIPLNTTNAYELDKSKEALRNSTAISLIGSIMSTALGWATYNPMMMAGGVLSGFKTIAEAQSKYNQLYLTAKIDSTRANFNLFNPQKVCFRITKVQPINNNLEKYAGKPLNKEVTLSSLNGFTQLSDIHLENVDILSTEKELLMTLLKDGFII